LNIPAEEHLVILGLGGNVGDPVAAMAGAINRFDQGEQSTVRAVSRLYRTPPWGKTDQPDFFNSCVLIATRLKPAALLALCMIIEREMKRERLERWGPRTLDIDILTYDDEEIRMPALEIPHPRMLERGFVLMPLADIAPDMKFGGRSVLSWLAKADTQGIVVEDGSRNWWIRP
jgi:2-amino-4-hydroxy-6-hydroxymethyldihydropteridine diphosphokinase